MYESILVPLDGSACAEGALAVATKLPTRQIRLLTVESPTTSLDTTCAAARGGETYLERIAEPLRRQGRTVSTDVVFGNAGEQIAALAAMNDLVVMGSRGCGATSAFLLGSVAGWVAHHAPVPVMIVRGGERPAAASDLARVVVALDGSPLAESALPVAERVATDLGLPIHLVRVLDFDPVRAAVQAGLAAADAWTSSQEEVIQRAEDDLTTQVHQLQERGLVASCDLRKGLPISEVLDVLREGDLVVLTTRDRSDLARWVLGSVADEVIRHAPGPVLLVRATGDSSPYPQRGRATEQSVPAKSTITSEGV